MRQATVRLIIMLLTFSVGVTCSVCYIVVSQYQEKVLLTRESVLQQNLLHMRKAVELYIHEKGTLPQRLDDLVDAGYMREVPVDPITEQKEWVVVTRENQNSPKALQAVISIHSASSAQSSKHTPYNNW